jgi:hypothetical protein
MLASLAIASSTPTSTAPHHMPAPKRAATLLANAPWQQLELPAPCVSSTDGSAPCASIRTGSAATETVPAAGSYADPTLLRPRKNDSFRSLGGFVRLDILADPHLHAGPEFSWSSPESPREDLQKMRLVSPGWGLRYFLEDAPLAVGLSACSRIVMMGKQLPVVDPLTSEARIEFRLP